MLEESIERLQKECRQLETSIVEMIVREEEARAKEIKDHKDKINYMNELNADYKQDLEKQLSMTTNKQ